MMIRRDSLQKLFRACCILNLYNLQRWWSMPVSGARFTIPQWICIGVAVAVGALLRLIGNNQPFPSSDHAELAAIVTFFYPRDFESLLFSDGSTWNILVSAHGVISPLIGIVAGTIYGILGVHINEFWWNLPFVLVHLLTIPLGALLARRLAGTWAGVFAALLIAVLPMHVALSRASGVGHTPLNFCFHLITLLCFLRYIEQPTGRRAWWASGALSLNLLVDQLFPLLFVLVFAVGVLAADSDSSSLRQRIARARELIFAPRIMLLPFGVLCLILLLVILNGSGMTDGAGIATRLFAGSDRQPGIYLSAFVDNARYIVGTLALVLLAALGAWRLPALWRLELRALPLAWSLLYLLPFLLFTRPHVHELFLIGIAPLTINAATVLGDWVRRPARPVRWASALALVLLVGLFSLRTLSMVFSIDVVGFVDRGGAVGGLYRDQGLKAAALWVRTHTEEDELIFADAAYEPYQLWYYLRRPFLGLTDAERPEDAYLLLTENPDKQPALYLVKPHHVELLERYASGNPRLQAQVMVEGEPALLIYGHDNSDPASVETIVADQANQQFDARYGSWRAMFHIGEHE
jgi:hypothetical protein